MYHLIITLFALFAASFAGELETLECPDAGDVSIGYLDQVYSPNFTAGEPIVLYNQKTYTFGMKFYAGFPSPTLVPKIYAIIGGIAVPWSGAGNDACLNLVDGPTCPLVQDEYYHYLAQLSVPAVGNLNNIVFQWALKDTKEDGGKSQACFRMNVNISS